MNKMKKAFALILTLAIVMSMSFTAFAAEPETGTITIENSVNGFTYNCYRIFDLVTHNDKNYGYKVNTDWSEFVATVTWKNTSAKAVDNSKALVKIDADGYVTACEPSTGNAVATDDQTWAKLFGAEVKAWLKTHKTMAVAGTVVGDGKTVTSSALTAGYYYVSTTLGSLVALDTVASAPNAVIGEKNSQPEITKAIVEPDGQDKTKDVAANTAAVGDKVNFKIEVTVGSGAETYVVHDTLAKGLTFDNNVAVKRVRNTASVDLTSGAGNDFQVSSVAVVNGISDFNITFLEDAYAKLQKGDVLVITYSATVNADAIDASKAENKMDNTAHLDYGHLPEIDPDQTPHDPESPSEPTLPHETPDQKTTTYNFNIDILKFTGSSASAMRLPGAQFKLRQADSGNAGYSFTGSKGSYTVSGKTAEDSDTATVLETDDDGNLALNGLKSGTYYLEEIKAPDGYNKPSSRFEISITAAPNATASGVNAHDTITLVGNTNAVGGAQTPGDVENVIGIQNNAGNKLPSTGGVGTPIFYVGGAVLMVAALVLLITKKKMSVN